MSRSRLRAAIAGADQSFFKYELNGQMRIEAREIEGQDQAVLVISDDFLKACNLDVNTQDMGKSLLPTQTYYPLFSKPANFRYIEWEKIPLIKIDSLRAGEHCFQIVCDPEEADEDFFQRFAERAIQDRLNDHHKILMQNNKNLVPFFHACIEMQKRVYKIPYDSTDPKNIEMHNMVERLFGEFQTTMRDIAKIYEAITTNTGCQVLSALFPKYYSAQSLIDENILEKYLARLHTQSKDFAVAKKGKIIGIVLIATAVLLVLAALSYVFDLDKKKYPPLESEIISSALDKASIAFAKREKRRS